MRFEDTMNTRKIATLVTISSLSIGSAGIAAAGDSYRFPSANGVQLSAAPPPAFITPAVGASQANAAGVGVANSYAYGQPAFAKLQIPLPPPGYASGAPYTGGLMSHALAVAPYANYAADYARIFAPNYAVSAWTDRVFGVVDGGYTAVDGWTAAAYGLPRLQGQRRRGDSAPDLTLMPSFRPHPELDRGPTFKHQGN